MVEVSVEVDSSVGVDISMGFTVIPLQVDTPTVQIYTPKVE